MPQRPGRCIPRISEPRFARFLALLVDLFENLARQIGFATHFYLACDFLGSFTQFQRDAANGADVRRHIFAAGSVAARDAAHKHSVFVMNRKREAVDFQLGHILNWLLAGKFATPCIKGAQLVDVVAVIKRQHGPAMNEFRKAFSRAATDTLRGAVRSNQLRVFHFQLAKLFDELVVFLIRNLRIVFEVIEVFVAANLVAQFPGLLFD